MPFTKADPNINTDGRPKGAKGKATLAKEKLIDILLDRMGEARKMGFKEFLKPTVSLLPKETKLEVSTDQPVQIDINFNIKKKEKEEEKEEKEGGDAKSHA